MIRRYLNSIFLRRRNRIWPLIVAVVLFTGWVLLIQQSEIRKEEMSDAKSSHRKVDISDKNPQVPPDSAENHNLPVSSEIDEKSKNDRPLAVEKASSGICTQSYQTEAKTDYQMFEMWKGFSKGGGFAGDYWGTLGPKNLPAGEKYKIFIMPMTHVDPGWLETFDEYSKDTNNILTYMVRFLKAHKDMRFTWCEMVFFERWWRNVTDEDKKAVKGMIDSGQLELTSGSWVMTDEANPYFPITVDNIIEGHQFLKKELDVTPKVMWSNDPFGYGPSVPYLFQKAGIKKAIINRVHRGLKMELQKAKVIPFTWRQLWDTTGEHDVHTHVLPFAHYDVLSSCGPNPAACCQFDFKRITHFSCPGPKPVPITDANVAAKGEMLFDQFKRLSSMYESPILLMVLGDDFRFNSESEWSQHYDNFIPLFKHMNEKYDNLEIGFGTYSDYFRELDKWNTAKGVKPKSVSGDFFPYNDWGSDYWTGYYTTRPFFKRRGRKLHAHIRAADLMTASAFKNAAVTKEEKAKLIDKLTMARRNMSLFQHHDAITGTSRVNVMENYGNLLWSALNLATEVIQQCASVLLGASSSGSSGLQLNEFPPLPNVSEIKQPLEFAGTSPISVAVYNQLPNERTEVVVLHVSSPKVKVTDGKVTVDAQIEPHFVPGEGTVQNDLYQLVFLAKIPALGFKVFHLSEEKEQPDHTSIVDVLVNTQDSKLAGLFPKIFKIVNVEEDKLKIKTSRVETYHDPSGYTKAVEIEGIGKKKFETTFHQYDQTRSGAYIFAPSGDPKPFPAANALRFVTRGPLQQTAHVNVARLHHSLTVREVPGAEGEQLHIYNTIDLRNQNNLELVTRFATDLNLTDRQFFSDSIGLQMFRREAYGNIRVEANYYPMPTAAFLQDDKNRVTILGDVSHGVTSPKAGQLEIMLDRILSQDDSKGLGYGANSLPKDNVPVTVGFTVVFETVSDDRLPPHFAHHSTAAHQALQALLYPSMVLTSSASVPQPTVESIASFPCDVQLLTNRPLPTGVDERLIVLSRPGVDCHVGKTPQVCNAKSDINQAIRTYLKSLSVTAVTETSLGGVEELGAEKAIDSVDFHITPMDLRAFKLRL